MPNTLNRRHFLSGATAVAASAGLESAWAQAKPNAAQWPLKPIRIVVAFPAGGLTDAYDRMFAEHLPTVVEQGIGGKLVSLEGGLPLMAPAGPPEAVLQALSHVVVNRANTERAAKLRASFAIPNKPKNLTDTQLQTDSKKPESF